MRRMLLSVLLVVVGLALVNGALAHLPREWLGSPVADALRAVDAYVGSEGSAVGAVFGLGLLIAAFGPLRNRVLVNLGILSGVLSVAVLVSRYYAGRVDVLPPIVFWVVTTALMMAFYPTRPRPGAARPIQRPAPAAPGARSPGVSAAPSQRPTGVPPSGRNDRTQG